MDAGVGLHKGLAQGRNAVLRRVLVIGVRDDVDGQLAGQLADRVSAHAVGHEKYMTANLPLLFVAGEECGVRILVMTAPNAHIGQACVFNRIVTNHQRLPQAAFFPTLYVCYNPTAWLHSTSLPLDRLATLC